MGLKKTIALVDNFGETVTFQDAYTKIDYVLVNVTGSSYVISTRKMRGDAMVLASTQYLFPGLSIAAGADNPLQQAYDDLKARPDYAGAVDVLEDGQTA